MTVPRREDCCILLDRIAGWGFEPLAEQLSCSLKIDISDAPRPFNYLLFTAEPHHINPANAFIPPQAVQLAADKRLQVSLFHEHGIATPETHLAETAAALADLLHERQEVRWCLKYPTGCGASGHRLLKVGDVPPENWPTPFIVQEFITMKDPAVYRTYSAAGSLFGWVVRRFPNGVNPSPWVAHARGARYENAGDAPHQAARLAHQALSATNLLNSFGCADLIQTADGKWLLLEVGTDGQFNHVDRELGLPQMENEITERITKSFWAWAQSAQKQNGAERSAPFTCRK